MCGIFGVFGHPEAANITYLGLHALQHRGQESAGIVSSDGDRLHPERHMGLVGEAFSRGQLEGLPGHLAIGHVRYSTSGGSMLKNAQPFAVEYAHGSIAVAHNGNLVNAPELRRKLEMDGSIFASTSDSEVIIHLIARAREIEPDRRIITALQQVEGAYSLLFLLEEKLIAVRDPSGFRPLCIGRLKDAFVFASESCAFDLLEAEFIREVEPGEMVIVDGKGLRSFHPFRQEGRRFCVFEHVYFARPDSIIDGRSVYRVREELGRTLAREQPVEADLVVPVPDSGTPAAIGYARESGIPYEMGLMRSHYVGRTFIEPQQSIRHFGVKLKLNAVPELMRGKRVVVVDDSLVRGTTARKIVKMLRNAGAREVHLRISSPPTTHPCFYGIDTPTRSELIASSHTAEEIARYVTCDSLGYLSREGMMKAVASASNTGGKHEGYCDACFTGQYPIQFRPGTVATIKRIIN
ncbi:MAG TPA: amidophosphoribosyltransferase [Polyangia bacterium]|jgi:amidophosphoribosyltransferase|nr:amidophosphoribosyltransferase [Polyangia bacterium]